MVQVFAENCKPERIQEKMFVFSWFDEERETADSVRYRWRGPEANQLGFCVEVFELPYLPYGTVLTVQVEAMSVVDYLTDLVTDREPAIRSDFDVWYLTDRLIYVKEQCGEEDVAERFFLHLDPVDADDLPGYRKQHGFDNLDFGFERYGVRLGEICFAEVPLPEYAAAGIRTGQYVYMDDEFYHPWKGEIRLDE